MVDEGRGGRPVPSISVAPRNATAAGRLRLDARREDRDGEPRGEQDDRVGSRHARIVCPADLDTSVGALWPSARDWDSPRYTCCPPTHVWVTRRAVSASGGVARGSPDNTARSACMPGAQASAIRVVSGGDGAAPRIGVEGFVDRNGLGGRDRLAVGVAAEHAPPASRAAANRLPRRAHPRRAPPSRRRRASRARDTRAPATHPAGSDGSCAPGRGRRPPAARRSRRPAPRAPDDRRWANRSARCGGAAGRLPHAS